MIDFKITFQHDELLYEDYEKTSSSSKNHVWKLSTTI